MTDPGVDVPPPGPRTELSQRLLTMLVSGFTTVVLGAVIVLPGGSNGNSVVAYDRVTGKRAWSALEKPRSSGSWSMIFLSHQFR